MPSDSIEIRPVAEPVRGSIRPPGSKSITNRAFVCAALAQGRSTLSGILDSEDTRVMIDGLRKLGIGIDVDFERAMAMVAGCGGCLPGMEAAQPSDQAVPHLAKNAASDDPVDIYLANSGTSMRFLTALCCLTRGAAYRLHGTRRMHERPIQDLIDALRQLGASVESQHGNGCPPVVVRPARSGQGLHGGTVTMRGDVSSQFLSALLMIAPYADCDVEVRIAGPLVSVPYVTMTTAVMEAFGAKVERLREAAGADSEGWGFCIEHSQPYRARLYDIEPDASAASYFWAAAAITGGEVLVEGLSRRSLQGDVRFVDVLEQMGCEATETAQGMRLSRRGPLRGVSVDMNAISDTAQTLAAVALFAEGPTTMRGIAHVRHKETDRIAALAAELRKLGAKVEEQADGMTIVPPQSAKGLHGAEIETYDDHRMAMSMALVGLKVAGVRILDPGCTAKTYPRFFDDLDRLCCAVRRR